MRHAIGYAAVAGLAFLVIDADVSGRGFGGGGVSRGSYGGGSVGHYGGAGYESRSAGTVVGPRGGVGASGTAGGSYTTGRGTTIDYGAAGGGARGPAGGAAGRGVGGVQVTTPGGRTATKVGTAGGAVGPGGVAVGGRSSVGVASGPGGAAVGAAGSRTAVGPGGAMHSSYGGGVAVGPYGAVAGGSRSVAAAGRYGTVRVSNTALVTQGASVRRGFNYYHCFNPGWVGRYPGAWFTAGWTANRAWTAATWGALSSYCGYPAAPIYYDYGDTVVYMGDTVYVDGEKAGTTEQYDQQATQIADAGRAAKPPEKDDWQPLGVFALVQGEEQTSYKIFQLAVNKDGVIRGNYYDALADNTLPVYGSVDKKTQRAAWSIGEKKDIVYEAGIANLTKDETPVLVHFSKESTQQFTLVRVQKPEGAP